ncbi:hypothetical protein OG2516_08047 [Oceanicola granulosus HTCC2516]|uniref:DUF1989 domain-containing protein n=1 Tax=Oceanicola granulosus (strain ATCC BAA-861 / DSM 15982 / KCTC 12143 / HTCC2516) TaxID=314256 RepID=Q2CI45_OCEGH|nr:DUF1989 domain-containing protein [Oceanicola granulosus]EAR52413.1 hypothetical protein OG2516_08047 [Oceanicola granulosus HTCC2516]
MSDDAPADAAARRAVAPVLVYPADSLPPPPLALYGTALAGARKVDEVRVAPRDAAAVSLEAGQFLRIVSVEGPQVGDLNLFHRDDLSERFYSGKTRALHGTHVGLGDRLWSCLPHLRPMATIVEDSLGWYGTDAFGGRVHDVIGTRCDPYTGRLLGRGDYHHCCHSNLTRALADDAGLSLEAAEAHVHDVLNVFMCTGFDAEGRYFMKASPVRPGDHLTLFAEIDLRAVLSACPGGDCAAEHTSDVAQCHPLLMEVWAPEEGALGGWQPPERNPYGGSHGR